MARVRCFSCGEIVESTESFVRSDECPSCYADVRCCRNCRFYDRSASGECREPSADHVSRKESANFCGFFEPANVGEAEAGDATKDARAKLDALFDD